MQPIIREKIRDQSGIFEDWKCPRRRCFCEETKEEVFLTLELVSLHGGIWNTRSTHLSAAALGRVFNYYIQEDHERKDDEGCTHIDWIRLTDSQDLFSPR